MAVQFLHLARASQALLMAKVAHQMAAMQAGQAT